MCHCPYFNRPLRRCSARPICGRRQINTNRKTRAVSAAGHNTQAHQSVPSAPPRPISKRRAWIRDLTHRRIGSNIHLSSMRRDLLRTLALVAAFISPAACTPSSAPLNARDTSRAISFAARSGFGDCVNLARSSRALGDSRCPGARLLWLPAPGHQRSQKFEHSRAHHSVLYGHRLIRHPPRCRPCPPSSSTPGRTAHEKWPALAGCQTRAIPLALRPDHAGGLSGAIGRRREMIRVPNSDRAIIAAAKLTDCLLNRAHKPGAPKARLLLASAIARVIRRSRTPMGTRTAQIGWVWPRSRPGQPQTFCTSLESCRFSKHVHGCHPHPHSGIAEHETLSEDLAPANQDGWMVLKRSECRHPCQLGRNVLEGGDPGHYLNELSFVGAFAEQIFHHSLARFHRYNERSFDRGDETSRAIDGTADGLGWIDLERGSDPGVIWRTEADVTNPYFGVPCDNFTQKVLDTFGTLSIVLPTSVTSVGASRDAHRREDSR